jgi:predicted transcriptional regulator
LLSARHLCAGALQDGHMPVLTSSNTVYTHPVAKVMISIPDKLLERLDARAKASGETRSGLLQRLAEQELENQEQRRREEVKRLMKEIEDTFTTDEPHFDVAQLIREDRESH